MKQTDNLSQMIRRLRVPASITLDEKVHAAITQAAGRPTPASVSLPDLSLWQILSIVMKQKFTTYTLGTALGLAFLAAVVLNHSTTSAWAMEQAIEALQK